MDTIFALASAQGKAGVAVIRVSGNRAHDAARILTGRKFPNRAMRLCELRDSGGDRLDDALVLAFRAPASFTGEDVVEFHVHGSTAVVSAVCNELSTISGLRLADPGEFTRRALENGKLDLTQVEALADLIESETEAQRKQAQVVLSGVLGEMAAHWRRDLVRAAALIEATIDFADEEVPVDVTPEVTHLLNSVASEVTAQIDGVGAAERIRNGFEVAIVGAPNVGKSTLLNELAGRKAAITSEYAGTTRDVIEVRMDIGGLAVTLLDTAGLRKTDDVVEGLGIALTLERARNADLRVFLVEEGEELDVPFQPGDICVAPKADLRHDSADAVSGKSGQGVDVLVGRIGAELSRRSAGAGIATRWRHHNAMRRAILALQQAMLVLSRGPDFYDIAAEEIRTVIRALQSLVGLVDVEDLLDEIFSSFCVGK